MKKADTYVVTVNTNKGLFCFNRLSFRVASVPTIFQKIIEGILKGIPGVSIYLDDILIMGKTEEEHLTNLEQVLKQLKAAGMHLKRNKCCFNMREVTYLGHRIDKEGLHTPEANVKVILQAPASKNITELRAFLGLLNYYGKFLPNGFHRFLLTANVLPLRIFLEYWCHPLTTQSMVPPGLKFSTTKVFLLE